jgi:peptide/nickel transport system permease protein
MLPGDPIYMLFNRNQMQKLTADEVAQIRHQAGLDRPLMVQYFSWIGNVFKGDLGKSILHNQPITKDLAKRIPVTGYIGLLAFLVSLFIGIPLGIIGAVKHGTWVDTAVMTVANIGITIPVFWLGIIMIWIFSIRLHWLPVMGFTSPFDNFAQSCKQLIMPIICDSIFAVSGNARQMRQSLLEVLRQDYIRTAWSKGLTQRQVVVKHALKNSLIPIVTMAGMGISGIIGGSVLIEQVFNIPGMGRLAIDSLFQHDYPYVQGITLIMTVSIVICNLATDISYGWLDPRIRYN